MDVVGSEIGQKMRSAIKAKLTELGCYVDDELPDYVMVMVANKRTRSQMEDDLQLFLGDNTELFVNWLHQVLKKLQEVTVTAPLKSAESEVPQERTQSKDRKSKDKKTKDKSKKGDTKKAKKKEKLKLHKKIDKKAHKSKKKSKHHEMIRPNIPPLLMNMEKDAEPSITDVFAGQILKNHGIILDQPKEQKEVVDKKPVLKEIKRPILPIIDPATIPSQSDPSQTEESNKSVESSVVPTLSALSREQHLKEMNMIEDKMQGLKQKLEEQLEAMSDEDEDFLNIRTEADELMNDFVEDVFQEVSQPSMQPAVTATPPLKPNSPPKPQIKPTVPVEPPKESVETLPQIELKLPKRTIREKLGTREEIKKAKEPKKTEPDKRTESPERFTPERQPEARPQSKSVKTRINEVQDTQRKVSSNNAVTDKSETTSRKLTSRVSVLESRCASVVRVRPRPRVGAPASSLLLRAVADAHKSLLNIPPKPELDSQKVKRALVLPMRRTVEPQKIVIQVPARSLNVQADAEMDADRHGDTISLGEMDSDDDKAFKELSDTEKEEYIPAPITKKITNTEYVPSRRNEVRTSSRKDDTLNIETINIHNPTIDKDRNTQFIVTMDGYDPNAFLAKKLLNEGLLNEDDKITKSKDKRKEITKDKPQETKTSSQTSPQTSNVQKKRLSNESEESDTQVIIKKEEDKHKTVEQKIKDEVQGKKRKGSPIVFDVGKKEKDMERERVRTESASSDNHVTVTTTTNTHKYDTVPPLSQAERKLVWCRLFPLCRYGSACAFAHPRCKFLAACTRRSCVYSHAHNAPTAAPAPVSPVLASHVVPAANYKTISSVGVPGMCKYYPGCANPTCHYYHPKPCRYGKNCVNKLECNFYHHDVPTKWKYPI
ncbi:hypothetical protein O3G_MSEX002372 [Manduca sexta]|uniref:Zinc finger CCCH domain-containing protein 14 n=1 Tax=Manduca sexta TaxID=7130 RepID=A0A921YN59_MANSE|nr:hypothetical protein O3G_MSEX002372 [Manduca sexta]